MNTMRMLQLVLCLSLLGGIGCRQPHPDAPPASGEKTEGEPLLLLDDEAPLLLLSDDGTAPESPMADNSRCFVCHVNYEREALALTHARADIGCADCHGESDEHIADESWASGGNGTAPEIMFPRDRINPACFECHARNTLDPDAHQDLLAVNSVKVCTDCHGNHRLPARKCIWK